MNKNDLRIDKFLSELRAGIAMPNKYRIEFNLPKGLPALPSSNFESMTATIRSNQRKYNGTGAVNIMCHSALLPERMLQTFEHKQMAMPYRVPYTQIYNPMTFVFYADSRLNTRRYFEIWQNSVVNVNDNTMNFYSEYTSDMKIYTLDKEGNDAYGIKCLEVYPLTIAASDLAYGNNSAQNVSVTFSYKYWTNVDDDRTENKTVYGS